MQGHNAAVRVAIDTGLAAWPGERGRCGPCGTGSAWAVESLCGWAGTSALDPEGFGCGGLSRS